MGLVQVAVTATATMLAVVLGGWLTVRAQDRLWRRDTDRQWRDIRLNSYTEFIGAFREYVAFILQPEVRISAVARPREPSDLMPFFDEVGTQYKERLEATKTSLRLVTNRPAVVRASSAMVRHARQLAASRAEHGVDALQDRQFDVLWASEREFVAEARAELGLTAASELLPRESGQREEESANPVKSPNDVGREGSTANVREAGAK